jgi:hypothetical protein
MRTHAQRRAPWNPGPKLPDRADAFSLDLKNPRWIREETLCLHQDQGDQIQRFSLLRGGDGGELKGGLAFGGIWVAAGTAHDVGEDSQHRLEFIRRNIISRAAGHFFKHLI